MDCTPNQLAGYGVKGIEFVFSIHKTDEQTRLSGHFAFPAQTHEQVDRFHAKGLEAGGTDNGKPGIMVIYHSNYYAAFPCGFVEHFLKRQIATNALLTVVRNKIEVLVHTLRKVA